MNPCRQESRLKVCLWSGYMTLARPDSKLNQPSPHTSGPFVELDLTGRLRSLDSFPLSCSLTVAQPHFFSPHISSSASTSAFPESHHHAIPHPPRRSLERLRVRSTNRKPLSHSLPFLLTHTLVSRSPTAAAPLSSPPSTTPAPAAQSPPTHGVPI